MMKVNLLKHTRSSCSFQIKHLSAFAWSVCQSRCVICQLKEIVGVLNLHPAPQMLSLFRHLRHFWDCLNWSSMHYQQKSQLRGCATSFQTCSSAALKASSGHSQHSNSPFNVFSKVLHFGFKARHGNETALLILKDLFMLSSHPSWTTAMPFASVWARPLCQGCSWSRMLQLIF